jgi:hypothetical protein
MKTSFLAALLLCLSPLITRADIVVPKPNQIVVTNLAAYPKVKFSIAGNEIPMQQIRENKTYESNAPVQLLVEDANHKPRAWAHVDQVNFRSESVKIRVKELRFSDKAIEVLYDTERAPIPVVPRKNPYRSSAVWPPFLVAGAGCCGLLLLAPTRRRKAIPK